MKSLELFSGAGGLAKGLELAGFEHVAVVESNRHACASLRENFPVERIFAGDVRDFKLERIGKVDIVAGGPPCQPFSLGGKHQAELDERDMFPHAIHAIEQLTPKAFIFENVKGLLRPSFADYFEYILLRLTYPGFAAGSGQEWRKHFAQLRRVAGLPYAGTKYDVQFKLLNAADYGIPQQRERVLIVGTRADLGLNWTFPEATHSEESLMWDQYVTGDYWRRHGLACPHHPATALAEKISRLRDKYGLFEPALLPWRTVRDALQGIPDARAAHGIVDHVFRDGARSYPGHTGSELDSPAKTLKAGGHGVPGGENMIRYADGSVRYLTVYEAKIIQTFPEDFVVMGAWGEAMRQLGNAVPVALAEILGLAMARTIKAEARVPQADKVRAGAKR